MTSDDEPRTLTDHGAPRPPGRLRRDLALIRADGLVFSLMVGIGETYVAAFALALGTSDVLAGLVSSLPLVAGGVIQLVAPSAMHRAPTYRHWLVLFASLQALTFVPLVIAALVGRAPVFLLFACPAIYWGAGLATAAAWNAWINQLVPSRIRNRYFAGRQAVAQIGVLAGLVAGGLILHRADDDTRAFAWLFAVAFFCRALSAFLLSRQSVPPGRPRPEGARARVLLRRAWQSPSRKLVFYIAFVNFAVNLASPFFTPFLLVQTKLAYGEFMLLLAANLVGKMIGYPLLGRLARRAGVRKLMAVGALGISPLPLLWTVSPSMIYLFSVQSLAGIFWGAFELSILLTWLEVRDDRERTSLIATYYVVNSAAVASASLLGGALLGALGQDEGAYLWVFSASAIGRVTGVALLLPRVRGGLATIVPPLRILAVRPWGEAIVRPVLAGFELARRLRRRRDRDREIDP